VANPANPGDELIEMAQAHFGELTGAEKNLLQSAPKGEWAQCGPNFSNKDPKNDPAHAETWGVDRTIRAGLLRWLCVDSTAKMGVDPRGVQVHGALVLDTLDLSFVVVPFPFGLWRCRLIDVANLTSAEIPALGLVGCRIGMLLADRLVTKGDVFLRHGFHAQGWVRLIGAKIGGKLDCVGGTFQNPAQNDTEGAGKALSADGIQVDGDIFLFGEFAAEGEVRLPGAQVGGALSCVGGTFHNPAQEGVNSTGTALNANGVTVKGSLLLAEGFRAEGEVRLQGAQIGGDLSCAGGTFHNPTQEGVNGTGTALNADGVTVKGSLVLAGGFRADGEVRLLGGAQIRGQLVCVGGTFLNPAQKDVEETGKALSADGIGVDGGIFLSRGFYAEGEVRLLGAKVGTNLECVGGTFHNPCRAGVEGSGQAFSAKAVEVKGDVFLSKGFRADGEVRLPGAHIGGDLQCGGGTFFNPAQKDLEGTGKALSADGIRVSGAVFLSEGFRARGEVRIVGAQIGGQLSCMGGTFQNPAEKDIRWTGKALSGDGLHANGDVFLAGEFTAEGEVRLPGAQIGGNLSCVGGTLHNPTRESVEGTGTALMADGINVDGSVNLCEDFHADGAVRLIGAQIGGDLNCGRGTLNNPVRPGLAASGDALQADRIDVKGGVVLHDLHAEGKVSVAGARIGMHLDCVGGRFNTLTAEGISVGKVFWWQKIRESAKATLNLTNATVDAVVDDRESWPHRGRLYLDGFVYGRFPDGPKTAKERLEWVGLVEPFTPQPYRQLAKVLRDAGHDRGANAVFFAMEDRLWRDDNRRIARVWRWILWGTVGYGYRPLRAFWCLLVLTLLGWGIYGAAKFAGEMVPTEEMAFQSFKATKNPPENYPRFFPLVYSLENSVPLIKLGQVDRWQPNPSSQASGPSGQIWYSRLQNVITKGRFLMCFRWGQIVAGWLLATLFVSGLTGIVRRV
jgi:hypothetical protein